MNKWSQPFPGMKGVCRVRPHHTKAWESGYNIVRWKESDHTLAMVEKAGSSFLEWVSIKNIEVPL